MTEKQWITYDVTWHTCQDDRTCQRCLELDGETWNFPRLTGILEHPVFGPIYDLDADVSFTHSNCRCFLEITPQIELENCEAAKNVESTLTEFGYMPSNIEEAKMQVEDLEQKVLMMDMTTRQFERLTYRLLAVTEHLGLPENIDRGIMLLERAVMITRMLSMSMAFLEMATPYGWIMGIAGYAMVAFSTADLVMGT